MPGSAKSGAAGPAGSANGDANAAASSSPVDATNVPGTPVGGQGQGSLINTSQGQDVSNSMQPGPSMALSTIDDQSQQPLNSSLVDD